MAVGDWQISRVYAELGLPKPSLQFAKSCLATCKSKGLSWLVPSANEGIARAYVAAKDRRKAAKYLDRARRQLERLSIDKEDKLIFLGQIGETETLARRLLRGS